MERYPEPIANFEAWFGDVMNQIKGARSQDQIDYALSLLQPYVTAGWCFPARMDAAKLQAEKTAARLSAKRATGEAA